LQHYATRADTPGVLHVLCLNEDPATGHALRIGKSELRGLQETATTWLREHGYEHHPETETAAVLAAEKATLEADIERLRTEATETRAAMQDMQNAAQETSAAVGIYETALKTGKLRPRIPETALRQAREYAQQHAGQHPGMGLVSRILQRPDALELIGGMAIIAPALLAGIVVSALAVTVYKAAKEQGRTVGASPTPPAEKEINREGLERMLGEMTEQVREAVRAVEALNRSMDEMERRMNNERRESDTSPVVMKVRESDWTAEMRESGVIYIRQGEIVVAKDKIPLDPKPTKEQAGAEITRIMRQCRRERETPGTPMVPTPANDILMAPEIPR
jgi:chromosome segregation ATPase